MEHMPINSARQGGGGELGVSHTETGCRCGVGFVVLGWVWSGLWNGVEVEDGREARLSRAPILVLDHARVVQVSRPTQIQPSRVLRECCSFARSCWSVIFSLSSNFTVSVSLATLASSSSM